jgi:Tat protein translocase TatB subunit
MFEVGFSELLLIFALALIVLGPQKLPALARNVGRWVGRARAMARQFREQLEQEAVVDLEAPPPAPQAKPYAPPPPPPPAEEPEQFYPPDHHMHPDYGSSAQALAGPSADETLVHGRDDAAADYAPPPAYPSPEQAAPDTAPDDATRLRTVEQFDADGLTTEDPTPGARRGPDAP